MGQAAACLLLDAAQQLWSRLVSPLLVPQQDELPLRCKERLWALYPGGVHGLHKALWHAKGVLHCDSQTEKPGLHQALSADVQPGLQACRQEEHLRRRQTCAQHCRHGLSQQPLIGNKTSLHEGAQKVRRSKAAQQQSALQLVAGSVPPRGQTHSPADL